MMKKIEWMLLSELMKNSKQSDRELAKKIGASQPTVTRTRTRLEKEGYIKEYTIIPDFSKFGFELMSSARAETFCLGSVDRSNNEREAGQTSRSNQNLRLSTAD
jgi:DNA-binding Lrp family transcriptional regulator